MLLEGPFSKAPKMLSCSLLGYESVQVSFEAWLFRSLHNKHMGHFGGGQIETMTGCFIAERSMGVKNK